MKPKTPLPLHAALDRLKTLPKDGSPDTPEAREVLEALEAAVLRGERVDGAQDATRDLANEAFRNAAWASGLWFPTGAPTPRPGSNVLQTELYWLLTDIGAGMPLRSKPMTKEERRALLAAQARAFGSGATDHPGKAPTGEPESPELMRARAAREPAVQRYVETFLARGRKAAEAELAEYDRDPTKPLPVKTIQTDSPDL